MKNDFYEIFGGCFWGLLIISGIAFFMVLSFQPLGHPTCAASQVYDMKADPIHSQYAVVVNAPNRGIVSVSTSADLYYIITIGESVNVCLVEGVWIRFNSGGLIYIEKLESEQ